MLHIPILRHGQPYRSIDQIELVHHATGQPVATVSQANPGLISRDIGRMAADVLDSIPMRDMLSLCKQAAGHFMASTLPLGDDTQSFDDYIVHLSATTGMPQVLCRNNARKIHHVLDAMEQVLSGLTRGFDLSILDRGYGLDDGRMLSWFRQTRVFGAVLPSNSPGVHSLWLPAVALKTPIALKPGREEPWTPYRLIQAFIKAGLPREAFGFYPTDHGGASTLLGCVGRSMLFGDPSTTRPYRNNPSIELHGPGYSKVILGEDAARDFERYLDVIISSILANGGRSCINASAVWTPANADRIADAIAQRLAQVKPLPADHPDAQLAAFANPQTAERINQSIDAALGDSGADVSPVRRGGTGFQPVMNHGQDAHATSSRAQNAHALELTEYHRRSPRLSRVGRCAYLLPTIIRCDRDHPLANREFLFPFASVIECPAAEIPDSIGPTLAASALTDDPASRRALMNCASIDRLNFGPIPTWQLSWDQPHEGNLFEHLYRQRAFQLAEIG